MKVYPFIIGFICCSAGLTSCFMLKSSNKVNYLMLYSGGKSSIDNSLGHYVVLKNGDTIRREDLKIKWDNEPEPNFFYQSKKMKESEYISYQSRGGFSSRFVEEGGFCCADYNDFYHRIRKGKIQVYYKFDHGSAIYPSKIGTTSVRFFFKKGKEDPVSFRNIESLQRAISDNSVALAKFNNEYSRLKKKRVDEHYKTILKLIDIYNE